ncbi:hypothetical protein VP01_3508g1 [Puccinia sorghi]|uniref:Uncharacterized protein n=1 Tax=Puccinia sorghi TaxID=27349 RepID=A0A0L6UVL3_9BASI|nr:hypothetical protein VP01_3508g1 [Puccinia sorghi]
MNYKFGEPKFIIDFLRHNYFTISLRDSRINHNIIGCILKIVWRIGLWVAAGVLGYRRGDSLYIEIIVLSSHNRFRGKIMESKIRDHKKAEHSQSLSGLQYAKSVKPKGTQHTLEKDTQLPTETVFLSTAVWCSNAKSTLHRKLVEAGRARTLDGFEDASCEAELWSEEGLGFEKCAEQKRVCVEQGCYGIIMCYSFGRAEGGDSKGKRGEELSMGGEAQTPKSWVEDCACRAAQPLLHHAWNVWAAQPLLHHAWNVWWKCVERAIYSEACRVAQHLLHCAWNVWVTTCVDSTAIYASGCRACTALVQLSMKESRMWLGKYGNRSPEAAVSDSSLSSNNFVYKGLLTIFTTRITVVAINHQQICLN